MHLLKELAIFSNASDSTVMIGATTAEVKVLQADPKNDF
jgi:hypothetical protein